MIFDTHAHYDDEAYDEDRETTLDRQWGEGIGAVVNCGADIGTSYRAIELAGTHEHIYAAVGIHPDSIGELNTPGAGPQGSMEALWELAANGKCVAIGEIGLDYHWNRFEHEQQKAGFVAQWRLAKELGLPVVIHSRDAAEDTLETVRMMHDEYSREGKPFAADMHCYSYSARQAALYLDMGLYFGIGGVLTFKNARKLIEVVEMLPMERILLETDCPYLAPEPHRGKRNESSYLKGVAAKIAELKGLATTEVEQITFENACRFYGLPTRR